MNYPLVLRLLGILTLLVALSMPVCLPWALADGDLDTLWAFLVSMGGGAALGGALLLAGRGTRGQILGQREGLLVVSCSWLAAGVVGALPFWLTGAIPLPMDALFESISGFTTTGASVLREIETLPRALLFWRSLIQWLGGMGIVVLFVAVLPGLGIGGRFLYKHEVPGPSKAGIRPHVRDTASLLWKIYLGMSLTQVLLLHLAGVDLFESLCHTFTTMATGGYSTRNASIAAFRSFEVEIIIGVFMLAAGVNFTLYANLWRGGSRWSGRAGLRAFLRDPELRVYLWLVGGATLLLAGILMTQGGLTPGTALRQAGFQAISVQTTTGFATADFDAWPQAGRLILVLLMFVGGCAGSTGGSMKVMRVLILARLVRVQVRRFFRPRRITSVRVGDEVVDEDMLQMVTGFFLLFVATWIGCTLALAALGSDLVTAATAAIACLGNVGPGLGAVGPMANFYDLDAAAKGILSAAMIVGRLEVFTVFCLLSRSFWRP